MKEMESIQSIGIGEGWVNVVQMAEIVDVVQEGAVKNEVFTADTVFTADKVFTGDEASTVEEMSTAEEEHSVEEVETVEDGSKAVRRGGARGRKGFVAGDRLRQSQRGRRRLTLEQRVSRGVERAKNKEFVSFDKLTI